MRSRALPRFESSTRAGGEIDVALRADRVLRAVVLGGVGGVVEQRVDRLVALEIDDAKVWPRAHDAHPRLARRDDLIDRRARASSVAGTCRSVLMKPRAFSGQRVRHGSSAPRRRAATRLQPDGLRRVCRAPVERMRPGVQHHERVHLEAQIDVLPGARSGPRASCSRAGVVDDDLAEEVDVGDQVALAEPVLAELDQQLSRPLT